MTDGHRRSRRTNRMKITMTRKADLLRNQVHPAVLGYELDRETLLPLRHLTDTTRTGDYGADPIGDGTFRMVPSGDVVDYAERCRRLKH